MKLVRAAGFAPALATFATSCRSVGLREQMEWIRQSVLPRQDCFTNEIRRLRHGGKVAGMLKPRSLRCCPGPSGLMKPTRALARLRCLRTATIAHGHG